MNASTGKNLIVAIVLVFLVIVAVMPLTDRLTEPELSVESNGPDYRLSSVEGYEAAIEIAEIDLLGVPSASYTVTEGESVRTVSLQGYDTRVWAFGSGFVLLTSEGVRTPEGTVLDSQGDSLTMSSGAVTAGSYTATYTDMAVPDEGGSLGHYSSAFRIDSGSEMQVYNLYGIGSGTVLSVSGWTVGAEKSEASYEVSSATDSEGYDAIGFVAPVEYHAVEERSDFASTMFSIVPLLLLIGILGFAAAVIVGGRS